MNKEVNIVISQHNLMSMCGRLGVEQCVQMRRTAQSQQPMMTMLKTTQVKMRPMNGTWMLI